MHTYCVLLRPQHSLNSHYPRTKRYYLRAKSAAEGMLGGGDGRLHREAY
jgi:hypothetical protein